MRVLICGGGGYIGSFTVKALARAGYEVVVLDNFSAQPHPLPDNIQIVKGDYGNEGIHELLHEFNLFIVFSGKILVDESMSNPWHYWNENVFKLTTFLNNLPENSKVVFSSSAAVYKPSQTKLTEESSCEPTNVYGVTKLAAENVLKHFSESKISAVCLRYFNAAGGELDGSAAENHSPETHFIPRLCLHYMGRISDFKIYGTDYPTKDGTCIRDFVHILDLAAGHLKAIEYLSSNSGFRVINLGSGIGYSLYDVIEEFEGLVGKKVSIEIGPRRHGDPPFLVADISKAKQLLNWQPRFSLRDMLKSQLTWLESKI